MTGCFHMTNFREIKWKRVFTFYTSLPLGTQQQTTESCSCIIFFYLHTCILVLVFYFFLTNTTNSKVQEMKCMGTRVSGLYMYHYVNTRTIVPASKSIYRNQNTGKLLKTTITKLWGGGSKHVIELDKPAVIHVATCDYRHKQINCTCRWQTLYLITFLFVYIAHYSERVEFSLRVYGVFNGEYQQRPMYHCKVC